MQAQIKFTADRFLPPNPKNTKTGRYLIIGFDTEYERESFENADGEIELRNKVLSYQYSCHIVSPDNADDETQWSGIVLPKGHGDEDRLYLAEFVEHAVRAGFRAQPDLMMPVDVYLVAHFTRADVPGFETSKTSLHVMQ